MKRSLSIAGHRTSISLEQEFWDALTEIANSRSQSVASLVAEVDELRLYHFQNNTDDEIGMGGLSSALRIFILRHYRQSVT